MQRDEKKEAARRQFLTGCTAVGLVSLLGGCGEGEQSATVSTLTPAPSPVPGPTPSPAPTPSEVAQPVPQGVIAAATLTVSATTSATIPPEFTGISYEKASLSQGEFVDSNSAMVALFRLLGPSLLRIGGNTVDTTVWNPAGAGGVSGETAPADVDRLAGFLKATGWRVLYGVNLAGAHDGSTSPTKAADEVAYASKALGASLASIEIGNEPDHYTHSAAYFPPSWTANDFIALWESFRSVIVARTPGVRVTGPSISTTAWLQAFATAEGGKISALTCHYYRAGQASGTATIEDLLSNDSSAPRRLSVLAAAADSIRVPYRFTECNSYSGGGKQGVSDGYAAALWTLQFLTACAAAGAAGANFHCGKSSAYSAILEQKGVVSGVAPEFYGLLLFSKLGTGRVLGTRLEGATPGSVAVAISRADGTTAALITNTDLGSSLALDVHLSGAVTTAAAIEMRQGDGSTTPDLSATSAVSIQGGSVDAAGRFTFGTAYTLSTSGNAARLYVPAGSAVLVELR